MNEVIWSGKGSLPGMSGEGWGQRGASVLTTYALDGEPSKRHETRKLSPVLICACGARKRADWPTCAACDPESGETRRCKKCGTSRLERVMTRRQSKWWCDGCAPPHKGFGGRPKAKQLKGGA